jgi:hypothetical protein
MPVNISATEGQAIWMLPFPPLGVFFPYADHVSYGWT